MKNSLKYIFLLLNNRLKAEWPDAGLAAAG